jgi:hypothetical protein
MSRRVITTDNSLDDDQMADLLGSDNEDNASNKYSTAATVAGLTSYVPRAQRQPSTTSSLSRQSSTSNPLNQQRASAAASSIPAKSQTFSSIDDEFNISGLVKNTLPSGKNATPGILPQRNTAKPQQPKNFDDFLDPIDDVQPTPQPKTASRSLNKRSTINVSQSQAAPASAAASSLYLLANDELEGTDLASPVSPGSGDSRPSTANAEEVNARRAQYKEMKAKRAVAAANKSSGSAASSASAAGSHRAKNNDPFAELDDPLAEIEAPQPNRLQQLFGEKSGGYSNQPSAQPRQRRSLNQPAPASVQPSTALVVPALSFSAVQAIPTLERWFEWLGLNPRAPEDKLVLAIAKRAQASRLPSYYKYNNGLYINSKTGESSDSHPGIRFWKKKLDEKRLKLRFGVTDDSENDEAEDRTLHESDLESSREPSRNNQATPSSTNRSFQYGNNPLSPPQTAQPANNPREMRGSAAVAPPTAASAGPNILTIPEQRGEAVNVVSTSSTRPTTGFTAVYSDSSVEKELETRQHRLLQLQSQQKSVNLPFNYSAQDSPEQLLTVIKQQQLRIAEFEAKQVNLIAELQQNHASSQNLLIEQRHRLQTHFDEQLQRLELDYSARKRASERQEASLTEQIKDLHSQLQLFDVKKAQAIAEAVRNTELRQREATDHAIKLQNQTFQQQTDYYQREIEQIKSLHSQEMKALREGLNSASLINNLTHSLEHNTSNLSSLQRSFHAELAKSTQSLSEQLTAREKLVREKEEQLELDRQHNNQLLNTFEKLRRDNEAEKLRFERELSRLVELQADFKAESVLLRAQLSGERESFNKEKFQAEAEKQQFRVYLQRAESEIELRKSAAERANNSALKQLEEVSSERNSILAELDSEREELQLEKRNLAQQKQRLAAEIEAFKRDEAALLEETAQLQHKMGELEEWARRIHASSEAVATLHAQTKQEREQNEQILAKLSENQTKSQEFAGKVEAEAMRVEQQKIGLLKQQKKFLTEKHGQSRRGNALSNAELKLLEGNPGHPGIVGPEINSSEYIPFDTAYYSNNPGLSHLPITNSTHAALRRAVYDLIQSSTSNQQFIASKFGSNAMLQLNHNDYANEEKYNYSSNNNDVSTNPIISSDLDSNSVYESL